jgi:hypothetical protein
VVEPRDYFAYRSDDGKIYMLRHDRSHLEAVGIPTCQFSDEYLWATWRHASALRGAVRPDGKTGREVLVDDVTTSVWTGETQNAAPARLASEPP